MMDLNNAKAWLEESINLIKEDVDAESFADYLLPLFFLRRFSDLYEYEYQNMVDQAGEEVANDPRSYDFYTLQIPNGCSLSDVRDVPTNQGKKLNEVLLEIASKTSRLESVFSQTDYNNSKNMPRDILISLIEHFSDNQYSFTDKEISREQVGDLYEYYLKEITNAAPPKKAEKSYTPREVIKVMVGILSPDEGMKVYDPCCGSGGMLIGSQNYLQSKGKNSKNLFLYGQDNSPNNWTIAILNDLFHDMDADIQFGNSLGTPKQIEDESMMKFDITLSNPVWNQKDLKKYQETDSLNRFGYGFTPKSKGDWCWIQHMLASLKETGRMGIVLDQGALFRGGAEKKIRKAILVDDLVECVIALPEKLFSKTGAAGCLILFNKVKLEERKKKVLFIYASEKFEKHSNMNLLRLEDIELLIDTFNDFADIEKFSIVADLSRIDEEDYNLSVTRYVDIFDPPEPIDLQEVITDLEHLGEQRKETEEKLRTYLKEMGYIFKKSD
jgi:type I restriction enzyme M protein